MMESPTYPVAEIEGLVTALRGVLASSVVLDGDGRIDEIHVLSEAHTHPKQIVRNVESALGAGLGIIVDRRVISVAQVRPEHEDDIAETLASGQLAGSAADSAGADAASTATPDLPVAGRYIFVGYDARTQPDLEAACRVTLRRGDTVFSGSGTGASTPLGRAQSAARAVFATIATARRSTSIGLEGVTLLESHGRSFVLVSAHADAGRSTVPLTGIALLQRSPEEAAILASLQATNRWNEFDG